MTDEFTCDCGRCEDCTAFFHYTANEEKLERVARRLYEYRGPKGDLPTLGQPWDQQTEKIKHYWREMAKFALS